MFFSRHRTRERPDDSGDWRGAHHGKAGPFDVAALTFETGAKASANASSQIFPRCGCGGTSCAAATWARSPPPGDRMARAGTRGRLAFRIADYRARLLRFARTSPSQCAGRELPGAFFRLMPATGTGVAMVGHLFAPAVGTCDRDDFRDLATVRFSPRLKNNRTSASASCGCSSAAG